MKEIENERRDWVTVLVILLLGLLCVFLAGGSALRFSPSWTLNADMGSGLNPGSDSLTRPSGLVQAIDPAILTPPVWMDSYLTEGAVVPTRIHVNSTLPPLATSTTRVLPTFTSFSTGTSTRTQVYLPPANTATPYPTHTKTPKPKTTLTATSISNTPTNTPIPSTSSADLQITKTDNAADYARGISVQYVIVVSNPSGPNGVNSAVVSDAFSSNLTNITWTCVGSGGASCTASGLGNIHDTTVNLPLGSAVSYTVNAAVIGSPNGFLINTATVNIPAAAGVIDPNPSNNSATDTDSLITAIPIPSGSIGHLATSSYSDYQLGTPLVVGSGSHLVYYPQNSATPPTLDMDLVILQISDGRNWYTVFNWGDGVPDTDTDINPADCPSEADNCPITLPPTNPPGITITASGIPNGTYPYIRIISPADSGDGLDVNTITVVP